MTRACPTCERDRANDARVLQSTWDAWRDDVQPLVVDMRWLVAEIHRVEWAWVVDRQRSGELHRKLAARVRQFNAAGQRLRSVNRKFEKRWGVLGLRVQKLTFADALGLHFFRGR